MVVPDVVPTIDLTPWWRGDDDTRAGVAERVDGALCQTGFVELTGHGIAPSLMDRMMTVTTEFFDRPERNKSDCGPPAPHVRRGYRGRGVELFESFHAGPEPGGPAAPNIWPHHVPMLREVWVEYFDALQDLATRLEDLFAVAMGRPAGAGGGGYVCAPDLMRANNYERRPGEPDPEPGQMRMGAHSDGGACTLLLSDPVPGLEILGRDGRWHGVTPEPGNLLLNVGDLLAQWTARRWRSTVHRVVPPPEAAEGPARRRSIAFLRGGDSALAAT